MGRKQVRVRASRRAPARKRDRRIPTFQERREVEENRAGDQIDDTAGPSWSCFFTPAGPRQQLTLAKGLPPPRG